MHCKMKRIILFTLIIILAAPCSDGQLWKMRRWEAMGGIGPSFFFGDIGGFTIGENALGLRDLTFRQTRFAVDGSLKYRIAREFNARLSFSYIMLHGTDKRGTNTGRQMDASTSVFEPAILGEYYFFKNKTETSWLFTKGRSSFLRGILRSLDFYAFTGIGGAAYSVKGNSTLESYPSFTKSGFTAVIPVGLGTTLIYTPNINLGAEIGGRYVFSDYLDGYSNPQYSRANDVYYFLNFTVTYKLKTGRNGLPSFR